LETAKSVAFLSTTGVASSTALFPISCAKAATSPKEMELEENRSFIFFSFLFLCVFSFFPL
jgi:maltodextrin utilization protein YvdJ